MGWIRIRMDPELLPGSGTQKIQSRIRTLIISICSALIYILSLALFLNASKKCPKLPSFFIRDT